LPQQAGLWQAADACFSSWQKSHHMQQQFTPHCAKGAQNTASGTVTVVRTSAYQQARAGRARVWGRERGQRGGNVR